MQFVAVDVETANSNIDTICQIGLAKFSDGRLVDEWKTFVDPEDEFSEINISIHGITPNQVKGAPLLPEVSEKLRSYLENTVSICHTSFDRTALNSVFHKYNLPPITTTWLDSARVVRRTWKDLAWKGYGLENVCKLKGIGPFKYHDALEDAKAAGYVMLAAMQDSQIDLEGWLNQVSKPIDPSLQPYNSIHLEGNPEGDLFGEVVVFTGTLELPRREIAVFASRIGCRVEPRVTKETTLVVVGDQDLSKLNGHDKSSKHRKAEELALSGQNIRIIKETDFQRLVQSH
jgi:DNA polymerase-3 subunit epsilon